MGSTRSSDDGVLSDVLMIPPVTTDIFVDLFSFSVSINIKFERD
jgi:hypothetical protein